MICITTIYIFSISHSYTHGVAWCELRHLMKLKYHSCLPRHGHSTVDFVGVERTYDTNSKKEQYRLLMPYVELRQRTRLLSHKFGYYF